MYSGMKGAGVSEHIDTVGCVCSWSYMLLGKKRWWFRTPPVAEGFSRRERKFEVLQEPGDFLFWCVGYHHQTMTESDESLDVHGYVGLDLVSAGSFANNLTREWTSESAARFHLMPQTRQEEIRSMMTVAGSCSWWTFDGAMARSQAVPKQVLGSAALLVLVFMVWVCSKCCRCFWRSCRRLCRVSSNDKGKTGASASKKQD